MGPLSELGYRKKLAEMDRPPQELIEGPECQQCGDPITGLPGERPGGSDVCRHCHAAYVEEMKQARREKAEREHRAQRSRGRQLSGGEVAYRNAIGVRQ